MPCIEELETGDILLFTKSPGSGIFYYADSLISMWTKSPYVHCAFVIKDPSFIHPTLKGTYIWESGWEYGDKDPQDDKSKFGTQLTPIYEYLKNAPACSVFVRKKIRGEIPSLKLFTIHNKIYNKPYDIDIFDWLGAAIRKDHGKEQRTKRFWCSAFVTYILVELGFVDKKENWDIVRPADLSSYTKDEYGIQFIHCEYGDDERIM